MPSSTRAGSAASSSRAASPRAANSAKLKRDILAAATDLFSRKGYHGTTTQELADVVGTINKGALYYHIGKKEELLYRIHQEVIEEGIKIWSQVVAEGDPISERLRKMVLAHCQIIDRHSEAIAVFSEEMKYLTAAHRRRVIQRRDVYQRLLQQAIVEGVERGELATPDPHLATLLIMGMLNSTYRWYKRGQRLSPDEIAAILSDLILDGLAARDRHEDRAS